MGFIDDLLSDTPTAVEEECGYVGTYRVNEIYTDISEVYLIEEESVYYICLISNDGSVDIPLWYDFDESEKVDTFIGVSLDIESIRIQVFNTPTGQTQKALFGY